MNTFIYTQVRIQLRAFQTLRMIWKKKVKVHAHSRTHAIWSYFSHTRMRRNARTHTCTLMIWSYFTHTRTHSWSGLTACTRTHSHTHTHTRSGLNLCERFTHTCSNLTSRTHTHAHDMVLLTLSHTPTVVHAHTLACTVVLTLSITWHLSKPQIRSYTSTHFNSIAEVLHINVQECIPGPSPDLRPAHHLHKGREPIPVKATLYMYMETTFLLQISQFKSKPAKLFPFTFRSKTNMPLVSVCSLYS